MLIPSCPSLGLFPFMSDTKNDSKLVWTGEDLFLLGKYTDKELAKRLGVSRWTVAKKRLYYNIPPTKEQDDRSEWTEEVIAQLGKIPDTQIAYITGLGLKIVAKKRRQLGIPNSYDIWKTPENIARLGTMPDAKLAEEIGVTPTVIYKERHRRGILPYTLSTDPIN